MIWTTLGLKKALKEVLYDGGKGREKIQEQNEEIERLNKQIKELKLDRSIEEQELKHLVKMKEEKQLIELQKKENQLQADFQKKQMELQENYHSKVLKTIEDSRTESKELYTKIMERLPNVNVDMKR